MTISSRFGALVSVLALATAGFGVLAFTASPAGATTVSDQTSLFNAFNNAAETTIVFANDITISNCGQLIVRNSSTTLSIDGGTFTLTNSCPGTNTLEQDGNGALNISNLTISGGREGVDSEGAVTLTNSTITDVTNTTEAIGLDAHGDIALVNSSITNTTSSSDDAIGVDTDGNASLTNSTISGTVASGDGDAIAVDCSDDATLSGSTISGTSAGDDSFGVDCGGGATLTNSQILNTVATGDEDSFAIDVDDAVSLTNSSLATTTAGSEAFGVDTDGAVTMTDSSITATQGGSESFAIDTDDAVTLVRSTIAGTTAPGLAVGIDNDDTVTVINSTLTNNDGIAISPDGLVTLVYSDVVANGGTVGEVSAPAAKSSDPKVRGPFGPLASGAKSAAALEGQIDDSEGLTTFASVIAKPQGGFVNCSGGGTITSEGYNFADDNTCVLTGTGDHQGAGLDPQLGALANNGGPTPTLLPADTSPLVDGVPTAACSSDGAASIVPLTDQRSLPRPQFNGCDVGSVELQPAPAVVIQPAFTG